MVVLTRLIQIFNNVRQTISNQNLKKYYILNIDKHL